MIVILSKNNTFSYLLSRKEYDLVISKFNMHVKKIDKKDNVFILKSECFNSTYLRRYIERILESM